MGEVGVPLVCAWKPQDVFYFLFCVYATFAREFYQGEGPEAAEEFIWGGLSDEESMIWGV